LKLATYESVVNNVVDGDTFDITSGKRIRLANVDAYEAGTLKGNQATAFLKQLIGGRRVKIQETGVISFGRYVSHVWRASDNLYVNQAVINAGFAK
jgi:endonuclease YncB( thermonuclease family)